MVGSKLKKKRTLNILCIFVYPQQREKLCLSFQKYSKGVGHKETCINSLDAFSSRYVL